MEECLGAKLSGIHELTSMLMQASKNPYRCSSVYVHAQNIVDGSGIDIPNRLRLERSVAANSILETVYGLSQIISSAAPTDNPSIQTSSYTPFRRRSVSTTSTVWRTRWTNVLYRSIAERCPKWDRHVRRRTSLEMKDSP